MRMYDLIAKKRDKHELHTDEIEFMIKGYTSGHITDYQMSAMLMAIYLNGMSDAEISALTIAMTNSGDTVNLTNIDGIKVDKHSTGGVGDKTTLIITPIVAACGIKVAKMSGKGLGHTGGTVDKLESIKGYRTEIPQDEFFTIVNRVGASLIGQTGNLAPADKKLYSLRDVTATVESIPLIAASIMSKKLAAGCDCILLDVKTGSGAFMKNLDNSTSLAEKMLAIAHNANLPCTAIVTNMDMPLGKAVGNAIEVAESIEVLSGNGDPRLTELSITLSAHMLALAKLGDIDHCKKLAQKAITSGKALQKLIEIVEAQGGDTTYITDTAKLFHPTNSQPILASATGYIHEIDCEKVGISSVLLGAGRKVKEDIIDYQAGIYLNKTVGDYINAGDTIATLYANSTEKIADAMPIFNSAIIINDTPPTPTPLIYTTLT